MERPTINIMVSPLDEAFGTKELIFNLKGVRSGIVTSIQGGITELYVREGWTALLGICRRLSRRGRCDRSLSTTETISFYIARFGCKRPKINRLSETKTTTR